MAVPTLTSIAPTTGHSGGQTLIEIVGTGFALPPDPPATGPAPAPAPSLSVKVGGRSCTSVAVVSSVLAYALTPKGDPDGTAKDCVVQNLDASGVPIGGETDTLVEAFTFVRPDLTVEGHLAQVIRVFIEDLQRQIVENVYYSRHTDYDDEGEATNIAFVTRLPALVIGNVDYSDNREQHTDEDNTAKDVGTDRFVELRPPTPADIKATLVGVVGGPGHDNPVSLLNLLQAVRGYFKKNPWLYVPRDPDNEDAGEVRYELHWSFAGNVSVTHSNEGTNVEAFGGGIMIKNVFLETMPGLPDDKVPGVPAGVPAEPLRGFGWKALDQEDVVDLETQKKVEDDED